MRRALICFLKFPAPGHVKTRLAHDLGANAAAILYESLAERVITEIYPLNGGYDIILCVDPAHELEAYQTWIGDSWTYWEQAGYDLGERLNHAVEQALGEGYERIMLIGTDCIGMDEHFIRETFAMLDKHDFVIGPSTDGGYYLLALKAEDPWLFHDMPWSTEMVYPTTVDRIEARELTYKALEEKVDIDNLDDLTKFRKSLPEEHFLAKKIDQLILECLRPPQDP